RLTIVERATGKATEVLVPVLADDVDAALVVAVETNFKDSDYCRTLRRKAGRTPLDLHAQFDELFGELTHTYMRKCMGGHMSLMHRMIFELMKGPTWSLMCTEAVNKIKKQSKTSERNVAASIRDAWAGVLEQATTINTRTLAFEQKKLAAAGWPVAEMEEYRTREMEAFESSASMARMLVNVIPWEDWKTLAWSLQK
uniref:hypothetical protein n=1 Tax=Comamonas thiooxydans TaxID=363952 RepID=UPI001557EEE0